MLVDFARAGFTSFDGLNVIPREPFSLMDANEVV